MGLLIKGMHMPKSCYECPFKCYDDEIVYEYGCLCNENIVQNSAWPKDRRMPDCPLVDVVECKDCKFYTAMRPDLKEGICSLACRHLGDDGYCSEGERRTYGDIEK